MSKNAPGRLPRAFLAARPAVFKAACLAGEAFRILACGKTKRMNSEISRLFPSLGQPGIKAVIARFFRTYAADKTDAFYYPALGPSNIERVAEVRGTEHLDSALRAGKGAILIHAHFGNPQMLMPALGHRGYRVRQVGLSPEDVYKGVREITGNRLNLAAYIWLKIKGYVEKSLPVEFVHIGKISLKSVYEALENNQIIAMTVDGVHADKHAWDFLGRKTTHFMTGPVRVALKSGSPLLPLFVVRLEDGRHRVVIEPPIEIEHGQDREAAAVKTTMKFLSVLEKYVSERPWLYARFFGFHEKSFFLD